MISQENNYSENRGGANAGNAEENPVEANEEAQAEANANEMSIEEAPGVGDDISAELSDLGIN